MTRTGERVWIYDVDRDARTVAYHATEGNDHSGLPAPAGADEVAALAGVAPVLALSGPSSALGVGAYVSKFVERRLAAYRPV